MHTNAKRRAALMSVATVQSPSHWLLRPAVQEMRPLVATLMAPAGTTAGRATSTC